MAEMNISGIGVSSAAQAAAEIGTEALKKSVENKNQNTENKDLPESNENEQVELEFNDGKDDGKIGFGETLKSFGKGFIDGVKNLFGKKPSAWQEISERKQELAEQKQAAEKKMVDISEQRQELNKQTSEEITAGNRESWLEDIDSKVSDEIKESTLQNTHPEWFE